MIKIVILGNTFLPPLFNLRQKNRNLNPPFVRCSFFFVFNFFPFSPPLSRSLPYLNPTWMRQYMILLLSSNRFWHIDVWNISQYTTHMWFKEANKMTEKERNWISSKKFTQFYLLYFLTKRKLFDFWCILIGEILGVTCW